MTRHFNAQAAVLALLATVAMLSGVRGIAAFEQRTALAAAQPDLVLAAAQVPVQQVVVVGRRARV